jgi:hypothetical protein
VHGPGATNDLPTGGGFLDCLKQTKEQKHVPSSDALILKVAFGCAGLAKKRAPSFHSGNATDRKIGVEMSAVGCWDVRQLIDQLSDRSPTVAGNVPVSDSRRFVRDW